MKRSKNFTWLILGVITIVLGILIPFVFMQQSVYYEYKKDTRPGTTTYNIEITSKKELNSVKNVVVRINAMDDEIREYEVYYVKADKLGDNYFYELQCVVTHDWHMVDDIEEIEVFHGDDSVVVYEKVGLGAKIPIAAFACVIGAFMIFVNFFNNNAKNRTIELKEIIASSARGEGINIGYNYESEDENYTNIETKEETNQVEQTKTCEYCGTLANADEKICSSCGAKFKK